MKEDKKERAANICLITERFNDVSPRSSLVHNISLSKQENRTNDKVENCTIIIIICLLYYELYICHMRYRIYDLLFLFDITEEKRAKVRKAEPEEVIGGGISRVTIKLFPNLSQTY